MFDESKHKKAATNILRVFFTIIEKVKGDNDLVLYALSHLNGILEDSRNRIHLYLKVLDDINKPMNLLRILFNFIDLNSQDDLKPHRDIASHILALLIE